MQNFTLNRNPDTPDEIWFAEHYPIFTLGKNSDERHLIKPGNIPVIKTDRGGQITYHGPGQLMVYPLIDLRRMEINVRNLINALEKSIITFIKDFGFQVQGGGNLPGVYVNKKKIASIGLCIKRGCSFHGMAINADMELEPFRRINPCGKKSIKITQLKDIGIKINRKNLEKKVHNNLVHHLSLITNKNLT